jgi:hypothetical protein
MVAQQVSAQQMPLPVLLAVDEDRDALEDVELTSSGGTAATTASSA